MVALIAAVGGSVVARWICNRRVTGSNPVTVILRTSGSVDSFSNFQDK